MKLNFKINNNIKDKSKENYLQNKKNNYNLKPT